VLTPIYRIRPTISTPILDGFIKFDVNYVTLRIWALPEVLALPCYFRLW
jgi:hypothetical protein